MICEKTYWYYTKALDDETCDKIISLGLSKNLKTASTRGKQEKNQKNKKSISIEDKTIQEIEGNKENYYIRDSEISWLTDQWIYDLVVPFINDANVRAGWKYNIDCFEQFQFTKYNSPGGLYGWHNDGCGDHNSVYKRFIPGVHKYDENGEMPPGYQAGNSSLINKVRKLSVTINLSENNSYEGGNLKFDYGPHNEGERYHECTEIRPRGSIIIFPSFVHHQVTPVTKGTRYSLVLWSCGRPFK